MKKIILFIFSLTITTSANAGETQFTILNQHDYQRTVQLSRQKITHLLRLQKNKTWHDFDEQIQWLTEKLTDTPYLSHGEVGEGDWQANFDTYHSGALHLQQYPLYRLDAMNCQTFVQTILALLHAKNLTQFEKNYIKIAYGAANNPNGKIIRYDNRNHFIAADFNPINQHNHFLMDATTQGELATYHKIKKLEINRRQWFAKQQQNPANTVAVLHASDGPKMIARLEDNHDWAFYQPDFSKQKIKLAYIPKQLLINVKKNSALRAASNNISNESTDEFISNQILFNQIPTPSLLEIVIDAKKEYSNNQSLFAAIGTDLAISHLGILYRQTFKSGQRIYQKINCRYTGEAAPDCKVTPIICQKKYCHELMFAHATNAYPSGYYFYQQKNHTYTCTATRPPRGQHYTFCNRIERVPLFAYLTNLQDEQFSHLINPAMLGIHIEKLLR